MNQEHLAIFMRGKEDWNKWREAHTDIRVDLSNHVMRGANFIEANLNSVVFSGTDLTYAVFHKADLRGADLRGCTLTGAYLRDANLQCADLSNTHLQRADLVSADLRGAKLINANLQHANLVGANVSGADFSEADCSECFIHGISAWNVTLNNTKQTGLIITHFDEPRISVDDLEVAQFIYLLLNRRKLRNVFNAMTERGVLILGRFGGGGLEVLEAIAEKLREVNYLPIIFDFERPRDRDYTETVKTLAGLSHFVVADLSGSSVPKELEAIVPGYEIPFAFVCQADVKPFAMSVDLFKYSWVLRPALRFSTVEDLLIKLPARVIEPAEEIIERTRRAREKPIDEWFSSE